jgi:hypothetical protein
VIGWWVTTSVMVASTTGIGLSGARQLSRVTHRRLEIWQKNLEGTTLVLFECTVGSIDKGATYDLSAADGANHHIQEKSLDHLKEAQQRAGFSLSAQQNGCCVALHE